MAKVLVVDDHAANRQLLVTLLGYRSHDLLEAADGAEALAVARAERPDLVITDILMPTMDGYEFVRHLRDDPAVAETAVVFYTAHYHKDEAQSLAATCGVARILTKPCEPELILEAVDEVLREPGRAVASSGGDDFAHEHVRVITNKLSQTADELGVANQRLTALVEIGLQLASERDPQQLLANVCRAARELLGARYAMLAVGDRDTGEKVYFVTSGIPETVAAEISTPTLTAGTVGQSYRTREPKRAAGRNGGRPDSPAEGYPAPEALLAAPIVSLAHVYGWICLTDKVGAAELTDEDARVLGILAAQVGRIYENGSLYTEIEKHAASLAEEIRERRLAQQKVERLNRVHAVLSGINTLIVRERSRQQLFNEACRIAVDHGGFGIAWIDLLGESGELTAVAAGGADSRIADGHGIAPRTDRSPDDVLNRAIIGKRPVADNDLLHGRKRRSARLAGAIRMGYRSRVALPLVVDGRALACMSLLVKERDFFTDEEISLLKELADNISFALAHIEKEEQLVYLAFFDELTQLPNRTLFLDRIEQHLRAMGDEPVMAALVLLDVERFRMVNESLGSGAGDTLLRLIAGRLELTCHGRHNLARVSGNQFGIFLRSVRDAADVVHALENRVLACFADGYRIDGTEIRVSAKAGIALCPVDGDDAHAVFRNAEAALKKAKRSGDRYVFYRAEMNATAAQVLTLETRMRKAVDQEQFVLHYQPKYDVVKGGICGLEALIRWQDPETGLVPPGQFIPLLEETGLIVDVGRWTLGRALEDYCDWGRRGFAAPRIAVNVSAIEMQQRNFMDAVIDIVQANGDVPEAVELEITESLMMQDVKHNIRILNILRGLGITVAIDDFGTGYSSLSHIARLPIDKVKIDRSFVSGMMGNTQDMLVASMTIVLAHSLGVRVVAEGVETEEQRAALARMKCDELQGFLFSKPLPKDGVEAMLPRQS